MFLNFLQLEFPGAIWEYKGNDRQYLLLPNMKICFIIKDRRVCIPSRKREYKFPLREYDHKEKKVIAAIVHSIYIDFMVL